MSRRALAVLAGLAAAVGVSGGCGSSNGQNGDAGAIDATSSDALPEGNQSVEAVDCGLFPIAFPDAATACPEGGGMRVRHLRHHGRRPGVRGEHGLRPLEPALPNGVHHARHRFERGWRGQGQCAQLPSAAHPCPFWRGARHLRSRFGPRDPGLQARPRPAARRGRVRGRSVHGVGRAMSGRSGCLARRYRYDLGFYCYRRNRQMLPTSEPHASPTSPVSCPFTPLR
jgi:hypothetical protein